MFLLPFELLSHIFCKLNALHYLLVLLDLVLKIFSFLLDGVFKLLLPLFFDYFKHVKSILIGPLQFLSFLLLLFVPIIKEVLFILWFLSLDLYHFVGNIIVITFCTACSTMKIERMHSLWFGQSCLNVLKQFVAFLLLFQCTVVSPLLKLTHFLLIRLFTLSGQPPTLCLNFPLFINSHRHLRMLPHYLFGDPSLLSPALLLQASLNLLHAFLVRLFELLIFLGNALLRSLKGLFDAFFVLFAEGLLAILGF